MSLIFVFPVYTNIPNIDELPKNGDSQGLPQTHTHTHSRDAPCSPQEAIRNPLFHYPSTFCLRQVSIIPQKDVAPPPTCEHHGKWVSPVNNVVRTLFSLNTCCLLCIFNLFYEIARQNDNLAALLLSQTVKTCKICGRTTSVFKNKRARQRGRITSDV